MRGLGWFVFVLTIVGCSGSSNDDDVARDGGTITPIRDGGVIEVPCGSKTCYHPVSYCRSTPSAACVATDGGTCAAPEEPCRDEAVTGCTAAQTKDCVDLPADCDSCGACLILDAPCGAQITTVDCSSSPALGVRVQCPFP